MPIDTTQYGTGTQAEIARRKFESLKRAKMVGPEKAMQANELADARNTATDLARAAAPNPLAEAISRYSPQLGAAVAGPRQELARYAGARQRQAVTDARVPVEAANRTALAGAAAAELQPDILREGIRSSMVKSALAEREAALGERKQGYAETSGDRGFGLEERKLTAGIADAEAMRKITEARTGAEIAKMGAETGRTVAETEFAADPRVQRARLRQLEGGVAEGESGASLAPTHAQQAAQTLVQTFLAGGLASGGKISATLDFLESLPPEEASAAATDALSALASRGISMRSSPGVFGRLRRLAQGAAPVAGSNIAGPPAA